MLEMASLGSKVMQSRSVEFAKKFGVVFEVRSSFNLNPGTIIKEETVSMENVVVRGVSLDRKQAKVVIAGVPDTPGVAAKLFTRIAEANLNVDMIVQNVSHTGFTDITFTLGADDARKAKEWLKDYAASTQAKGVDIQEGIAKLSLVGIGMRSHSGVAASLFTALSEAGINIQMISTSEIKVSLIIDEAKADEAVRAVHAKFGLDKS
jgi:aspartate kinase